MKIIVTLDDRNGMTFNKRRQSQDVKLREYLIQLTHGSYLFLNEYSFKQFKDVDVSNIIVDKDFLTKASDEFCFVEDQPLLPHLNKISAIFICRWNRDYPSDTKFDLDVTTDFKLQSTVNIVGKSHEKITIEEWIR